jgi:hypothetical protein
MFKQEEKTTELVYPSSHGVIMLQWWSESSESEEKQVKKEGLVKSKSNSKPRQVWQKKVAPPLEAPLIEAPPQESSSSRVNQGTRSIKPQKEESCLEDVKF